MYTPPPKNPMGFSCQRSASLFCLSRPRRPTTRDARCAHDPQNTQRSSPSTRAALTHDNATMRCCCHVHVPHYCLPLLPHRCCHSAATALLRTATAAARTLMAPLCCCLADATLLPSPPTLQSKTKQNKATCKQPSRTLPASSRHRVLRHSRLLLRRHRLNRTRCLHHHPVDLAANAIASTAYASPAGIPSTRSHAISSTSPPFPSQRESGTTLLYGGVDGAAPRRPTPPQQKNEPPNPPPSGFSGKRGSCLIEVWVLSKGGVVSVHTTADRTVLYMVSPPVSTRPSRLGYPSEALGGCVRGVY